jgi:predicted exporter
LLPALGLALVTSIVGYGSLLQAPLPGLQEMAMFSITGLLATALFVLVVFPLLHRHAIRPPPKSILIMARLPLKFWSKRPTFISVGIALLVLMGLSQLKTGNDIRVFHVPDPQLLREQHLIEELLPGHAPNQFFLIRAKTEEALLQRAERLKPSLEQLAKTNSISGYTLLSDSLPSLQRQQQNHQLLFDTVYRPGGEAEAFYSDLGFDDQVRKQFASRLQTMTPLTLHAWLEVAPQNLKLTWLGHQDGDFYSIVLLETVTDTAALQTLANDEQGVDFVDTVDAISNNLEARMLSAARLLLLAYVAIGFLLILRYRKPSALRLLAVPLASSVLTLALLSACGVPINLFHVFALFLILGLGMDYGVFLRESGTQSSSCLLAIMLSALTSSLSFGLLALSSTPMISAFGMTILIGGMCNWWLAPLAADE